MPSFGSFFLEDLLESLLRESCIWAEVSVLPINLILRVCGKRAISACGQQCPLKSILVVLGRGGGRMGEGDLRLSD